MVNLSVTKKEVLDLYFLDARSKLIDLAAFLDRIDRAEGVADFRLDAFHKALEKLDFPERARAVLTSLSDLSIDPIPVAETKGAVGAPQTF